MVDIRKKPRENISSMIRKFSLKMKMSGVLKEARGRQFFNSKLNGIEKKRKAIKRISKAAEFKKKRAFFVKKKK